MYVSGKLKNVAKVLVDIGTGYFVEKVSLSRPVHICIGFALCTTTP